MRIFILVSCDKARGQFCRPEDVIQAFSPPNVSGFVIAGRCPGSFEFALIRVFFIIGMSFDLQPHLKGELIVLRPLRPVDWRDLFAVASDPLIWEQHPESDRYKEDVFKLFFKEALACGGALVVIDEKNQQIIGSTRFYGYDAEKSEIEIGWTFLARKYWGGRYNREMKQLMLNHAFEFVENVVFLVGQTNFRSQRAMEKIGARRTGLVKRTYGNHPPALNVKYLIKKSQRRFT